MRIIAAVVLALLGAATSVAFAAAPSSSSVRWTEIGGGGARPGTQLGLLREGGVLHVVSEEGVPSTIVDHQLNLDGGTLPTVTIASNFDGPGGLGLVGFADGSVRLFAAGGTRPGLPSNLSGINTYVRTPAGGWTLDPTALWGGAVASAASFIGATVLGNQPVTAWGGGVVHVGAGSSTAADQTYQPDCCGASPQLVTDSSTGAVVMAWLSNGHQSGTYVKQVLPTAGPLVSLPSGQTEGSFGLTARIGAPGTFVAYTGPTDQTVRLYNVTAATTQIVTKGPYRVAKAFAAPEGRLWMLWGDANTGVFATRSNRRVTKWEPVQRVPLPSNLTAFYNAQGEGSAGPLDAFADLLIGTTNRGFWHAHILPKDSLSYRSAPYPTGGGKSRGERVEFTVTDAGDPVKGAIIVVAHGGKTLLNLRTDANGHASGALLGNFTGGVRATASAPGYDNAIITVGK